MDVRRRPLLLLVVLVLSSTALAGCTEEEKDEVLRADDIGVADRDVFTVPKGTKKITFTFSTQPPPAPDCDIYQPQCAIKWSQYEDAEEDVPGKLTFTAGPSAEVEQGRPAVKVSLAYSQKSSKTVLDPKPGDWTISTTQEDSYDGPASARIVIPASSSAGLLNMGPLWDILGLVVALAGFLGAWLIYHRRARFLSRQLHRIDDTFTRFGDDLTECRTNLIELKRELNQMLVRRKLEEPQYLILERRIEQYLRDLETPGNRHVAATTEPETIPVFESEEETFAAGSALARLRDRRLADD